MEYAIQFESFGQLTHILTRSGRLLTPYSVRQKTNTHIYCIYCPWYETRCLRCLLSPCVSDEAALYCTCSLWITNNAGKLQVKTFYIQISKTLSNKKWLGGLCSSIWERHGTLLDLANSSQFTWFTAGFNISCNDSLEAGQAKLGLWNVKTKQNSPLLLLNVTHPSFCVFIVYFPLI